MCGHDNTSCLLTALLLKSATDLYSLCLVCLFAAVGFTPTTFCFILARRFIVYPLW